MYLQLCLAIWDLVPKVKAKHHLAILAHQYSLLLWIFFLNVTSFGSVYISHVSNNNLSFSLFLFYFCLQRAHSAYMIAIVIKTRLKPLLWRRRILTRCSYLRSLNVRQLTRLSWLISKTICSIWQSGRCYHTFCSYRERLVPKRERNGVSYLPFKLSHA